MWCELVPCAAVCTLESGLVVEFARLCLRRILSLYSSLPKSSRPKSVVLVGHSMVFRRPSLARCCCQSSFSRMHMWRFAADNPSTLSCVMRRAGPTVWKPRSALSEGFFLALWPGSIRIRSTGGIFGFPQLVYSPRYSRGGRRGRRLPSPQWLH